MLDRRLYQIIEKSLGIEYFTNYVRNFNDRIITQKVLYLLIHKDNNPINLNYKWTFYLHGPYSSEIAHMIYYMNEFKPNLKDSQDLLNPNEKVEIESLKIVLSKIKKIKINELSYSEKLELITSTLFFKNKLEDKPKIIFDKLKKIKLELCKTLSYEEYRPLYLFTNQI